MSDLLPPYRDVARATDEVSVGRIRQLENHLSNAADEIDRLQRKLRSLEHICQLWDTVDVATLRREVLDA